MDLTNAQKMRHGTNAQNNLESILKYCLNKNYITCFHKNYRVGKVGFTNKEQFYAPFLIEFSYGEKWALFSTTSMRTDRIKGQQWDAFNLKEIDHNISKAFIIYSDGISESDKAEFARQNNKYLNSEEYSAIDQIISQDTLYNLIEATALADLGEGKIKDIQGRGFEDRVAATLSSKENLKKWKTNDPTLVGYYYSIFVVVVEKLQLESDKVTEIFATTDKQIIGRLPSGGNPKTDILVSVNYYDRSETFGISCKRSSDSQVSVHQYTADAFANVLDSSNERLRALLNDFQKAGSLRDLGEEKCNQLTAELEPYNEALSRWVLGGIGGDGNENIQWAKYLLTYDNRSSTFKIHTIEEYCMLLKTKGVQGQFGTFFSWTYPSKRRGKDIQLKCKIL